MHVLILAGGSGTRFWPLSRRRWPKQLLPLAGRRSLLRQTVDRVLPLVGESSVWIVTSSALAEAVRAEVPDLPSANVLVEPVGRNTAPAIGWAVSALPEEAREGVVAVTPSDHRIVDDEAYRAALAAAADEARANDRVMTLGVKPRRPETGFGYLETGEPIGDSGARRVVRFTEKPDVAKAEEFIASGRYLWNAGIFVFRGATFLDHLARLQPEIGQGLARISDDPELLVEVYPRLPAISVDYAVMERLDDIGTVPLDCGWSDLGSWQAIWEGAERDEQGNALHGAVVSVDTEDCLLWSESGTIATLGVSGLAIVQTGDAVLIVPRDRAQEVRTMVRELTARGRSDLL